MYLLILDREKLDRADLHARTGKGQQTLEAGVDLRDVPIYDNLASVIDHLLGKSTP